MELVAISDKEDFINHYAWIKECDFTHTAPEDVLLGCLNGRYFGLKGVDEAGDTKAIAICEHCGDTVYIVGTWAKNCVKEMLKKFKILMKELGYKKFRASTNLNEVAYTKLLKVKKVWAVYEGDL